MTSTGSPRRMTSAPRVSFDSDASEASSRRVRGVSVSSSRGSRTKTGSTWEAASIAASSAGWSLSRRSRRNHRIDVVGRCHQAAAAAAPSRSKRTCATSR